MHIIINRQVYKSFNYQWKLFKMERISVNILQNGCVGAKHQVLTIFLFILIFIYSECAEERDFGRL